MIRRKADNPKKYYEKICQFFHARYSPLRFEYGLTEKYQDGEHYGRKDPLAQRFKNAFKHRLAIGNADIDERFAHESEDDFYRFFKASWWSLEITLWQYFKLLNPIFVVAAFFGGMSAIYVDVLSVFILQLMMEKMREQT